MSTILTCGERFHERTRCDTFERVLAEVGYPVKRLVWEGTLSHRPGDWDSRQKWLRGELRRLSKPLAVFAHNDEGAVDVIEACLAASIAVPDEVAVLGMLDMELFRESTALSLSSIHVDFDKITRIACDLLDRMMAGAPPPSAPILIPPAGVVARKSTETRAAHLPSVAKTIQYMFDHYAEPIGVAEIAHVAGVCKTLLYRDFKADIGETPKEVLLRIRMDKARQMLSETDAPIGNVAVECGFGDRVTLYRSFRRMLGCSPGAFRKPGG